MYIQLHTYYLLYILSLKECFIVIVSCRLRWPVKVNCWFCNKNTKVYRQNLDWWLCSWCEQYNGFCKVNSLKTCVTDFLKIYLKVLIYMKLMLFFRMAIIRTIFQSNMQYHICLQNTANHYKEIKKHTIFPRVISVWIVTNGKT